MAHLGLVKTLQIACKLQVFRDSGHLWLDSGPPLARSWPTLASRKPCKLLANCMLFAIMAPFGSIVPPFGSIMAHFGSIVNYFSSIKSSSAQIVATFSDSGPSRLDDKKLQPPDSANFEHEWDHFGSIKSSSAQIVPTFSDSGPLRLDDKNLQPPDSADFSHE
jgi:hypothetical protein